MKKLVITMASLAAFGVSSHAAVIALDLLGKAGPGLLGGNENVAVLGIPGAGGEIGSGFSYDNVSKTLTLNVGWFGLQGATIGSVGSATGFHIHGPVTTADPFLGNASVLHNVQAGTAGGGAVPNYTIVNNPNGSGQITGTISAIPAVQEADLLAGKWYVNIHSGVNPGGEVRGNLVVPEPVSLTMAAMGLMGLAARRRR
jgi:hypothetical protein